jgi:hypothetical protein
MSVYRVFGVGNISYINIYIVCFVLDNKRYVCIYSVWCRKHVEVI